jgi:hypothetical protein
MVAGKTTEKGNHRPEKNNQHRGSGLNHCWVTAIFVLLFTVQGFLVQVCAQPFTTVKNDAFARGEKVKFRACYDSCLTKKVTAGIATLEVSHKQQQVNERNVYRIIAGGRSKGAFRKMTSGCGIIFA